MAKHLKACIVDIHQLASVVRNRIDNILILDIRTLWEYNSSHVVSAVNIGCAKLMKRRLQEKKLNIQDFISHTCRWKVDKSVEIVVYDQDTKDPDHLSPDSFMSVFLQQLLQVYSRVNVLKGGFLAFYAEYSSLCESERTKFTPLTSLSQPCLPISNQGPTRILPFLYLGSQHDALDKETLQKHNITYELNVSTNCPKPDFIQDAHFMRIPVIDTYTEKLLPHLPKAFQFLDKVREAGGCALVHCLAGISRSATVAIAYVMRYMKMTSDEAYRYVKAKRATISPNFNFLGQLLEYEEQLRKENVLDSKQENSVTPMVGVLSVAYSERYETEMFATSEMKQSTLFEKSRLCCSSGLPIKSDSSSASLTNFSTSTKDSYLPVKHTVDISDMKIIPRVEVPAWDIDGIPASSLKELNFTPCQAYKSNTVESTKQKNLTTCKSDIKPIISSKISSKGICNYQNKDAPSNSLEYQSQNIGKIEAYKNLGFLSSDLWFPVEESSPYSDIPHLEFDKKEYNRSDSTSTSGLGSEGSECPDSWNEYHSSCEKETDILMDDEYSVPVDDDEFQRKKMLGFDESYDDTSLYPKYPDCRPRSPLSPSEEHLLDNYTSTLSNAQGYFDRYVTKSKPVYQNNLPDCPERAVDGSNLLLSSGEFSAKCSAKAEGLYRAQSCPGILPSDAINPTSNTTRSPLSGISLRRTRNSNSEKADKYRNRYSCSSLDYMEYISHADLVHESCPDVICSTNSGSKSVSSLSSSHRSFRHSMIEVS